ncbi:hypothetical protein ACF08M_37715 [Streptomyces sp. NPDC015032]|uniref:hypothetical protein n=1 Tax=Streptomyces sp. NPDC015032 TaxID=3364937 RepID=UPI0036F7E679
MVRLENDRRCASPDASALGRLLSRLGGDAMDRRHRVRPGAPGIAAAADHYRSRPGHAAAMLQLTT